VPARPPEPGRAAQPFGGWKGSGTTGKASGGPYYVHQYMREQSRTVIEE
jgi:1-pyrroline-5-carboxylate dehydrogenase